MHGSNKDVCVDTVNAGDGENKVDLGDSNNGCGDSNDDLELTMLVGLIPMLVMMLALVMVIANLIVVMKRAVVMVMIKMMVVLMRW